MIRHLAATAVVIICTASPLLGQQIEPLRFTVSTASANVHKTPSTGSPVVGKAPRGTMLEVTREVGDWLKVAWPEDSDGVGYVHRSLGSTNRGPLPAPRRGGAVSATTPLVSTPVMGNAAGDERGAREAVSPALVMYVAPPTHIVGLGGRMGGPAMGYGVSGRMWSRNRLGVQVDLSRHVQTSVMTPDRMTAVQFAPSVLYSLADRVTDYVWLRPYAGGGGVLHRQTLSGVTPEASISQSTFGWRAFGGTELTFATLPRFALSVDAGYDWTKSSFTAFDAGGFGFSISGHWYFK